jgi:hypothetical protein
MALELSLMQSSSSVRGTSSIGQSCKANKTILVELVIKAGLACSAFKSVITTDGSELDVCGSFKTFSLVRASALVWFLSSEI